MSARTDGEALLASARRIAAAGPGPGREELRAAYLELLKLALCDLVGPSTTSVGALPGGVMARELHHDERRLRAAGMDWPLQGLTMVGLARLDDLQRCAEAVVADGVRGDVVEAGSWRGGASLLLRATLDSLGDDRKVCVADSFQGFPAEAGEGLSAFDFLAAPLGDVRDAFARLGLDRGVEFVPGFFEETLPALAGRSWSVIRLDADTYEPTRLALETLYAGLEPGGFLVLDDYGSFEGCRQAVDEFRAAHGIDEPLERIDWTGARWRRREGGGGPERGAALARPAAPTPVPRPERPHVPTAQELALRREVERLEAELAAARDEPGLRRRLRRRLGRRPR